MVYIILTGATGLIGSAVLSSLIASPTVTRISVMSRRPIPDALTDAKVEVILHHDYHFYPTSILARLDGASGCIWAQGKSSVGMAEPDYTALTHDWPIAAAKAFANIGGREEGRNMNFVYISGEGADPTGSSRQLFARIKGLTEKDLIMAAERTPGLSTYNLRPAGVDASDSKPRFDRKRTTLELFYGLLYPILRNVAPRYVTPVKSLADVAVGLAIGDGKPLLPAVDIEAQGWTFRNLAIRRMAGL